MMVLVSPSTVKLTGTLLSSTTVQLIVALLVAVQLKEVAVPTNTTLVIEGVTSGRGTVEEGGRKRETLTLSLRHTCNITCPPRL